MKFPQAALFFIVFLLGVGINMSVFIVDQREQAILLQLGQPIGDVRGPGLHFKLPVVQEVRRFDRRILSVDPPPAQMVISSKGERLGNGEGAEIPDDTGLFSGEPIIVDTFARYRITDPLKFMKTLRTVEAANQRLESVMNESTRTVLGKRTLSELLSPERMTIMKDIASRVTTKIERDNLGIALVDVRIVRADLTPELRASTVRRMISELTERATETRAKGEQRALEIRSTAEKERAVLLAEAERDAQIIRGEGDKEAIRIYSDAYSKDKDFYAFSRSLEAYRKTMATPDTRLLLSPKGEFFQYFNTAQ